MTSNPDAWAVEEIIVQLETVELIIEIAHEDLVVEAEIGFNGGGGGGSGLVGDLPVWYGVTDAVDWPTHLWLKPDNTWEVVFEVGPLYPS